MKSFLGKSNTLEYRYNLEKGPIADGFDLPYDQGSYQIKAARGEQIIMTVGCSIHLNLEHFRANSRYWSSGQVHAVNIDSATIFCLSAKSARALHYALVAAGAVDTMPCDHGKPAGVLCDECEAAAAVPTLERLKNEHTS